MRRALAETVYSADSKRRMNIYLRDEGCCELELEKYSDDPYEHCWIPYTKSISFCDTLETARREAVGRLGLERGREESEI
jgi:hypothetical protein